MLIFCNRNKIKIFLCHSASRSKKKHRDFFRFLSLEIFGNFTFQIYSVSIRFLHMVNSMIVCKVKSYNMALILMKIMNFKRNLVREREREKKRPE